MLDIKFSEVSCSLVNFFSQWLSVEAGFYNKTRFIWTMNTNKPKSSSLLVPQGVTKKNKSLAETKPTALTWHDTIANQNNEPSQTMGDKDYLNTEAMEHGWK